MVGYELRPRRPERILTSKNDKRNFMYRQLHKYNYKFFHQPAFCCLIAF